MYIQCDVMRFNTLFIILLLISNNAQCMSLKNSLVETFSNNFLKLINNSSSLNNLDHNCDGVCISDINWYRCCYFNSPFSLVSVSEDRCTCVYSVSNTEDHIQSYFQHHNCNDLSTFPLLAGQSQMLIFENSIPTERNKIKLKTPSTHSGPILINLEELLRSSK